MGLLSELAEEARQATGTAKPESPLAALAAEARAAGKPKSPLADLAGEARTATARHYGPPSPRGLLPGERLARDAYPIVEGDSEGRGATGGRYQPMTDEEWQDFLAYARGDKRRDFGAQLRGGRPPGELPPGIELRNALTRGIVRGLPKAGGDILQFASGAGKHVYESLRDIGEQIKKPFQEYQWGKAEERIARGEMEPLGDTIYPTAPPLVDVPGKIEAVGTLGRDIGIKAERRAERFPKSKSLEGVTWAPGRLNWWLSSVGEAAPEFAAQMAAAWLTAGGSKLAGLSATGVKYAGLAAFALTAGGRMTGSTYVESIEEQLARGVDRDTAESIALAEAMVVGAANTALEAAGGSIVWLGKNPLMRFRWIRLVAARYPRIVQAFAGAVAEGSEEVLQGGMEAVGAYARGSPEAFRDFWKKSWAGFSVGAALGAIAAGARGPEAGADIEAAWKRFEKGDKLTSREQALVDDCLRDDEIWASVAEHMNARSTVTGIKPLDALPNITMPQDVVEARGRLDAAKRGDLETELDVLAEAPAPGGGPRVLGLESAPHLPHVRPAGAVEAETVAPDAAAGAEVEGAAEAGAASQNIAALFDEATEGPRAENRTLEYAAVDDAEAAGTKQATGYDVSGYTHMIDRQAIRHIMSGHGPDAKRRPGEPPVTREDIERIPEIVANPDDILRGNRTRGGGLRAIRYVKRINGDIVYVEEVRTGKRILAAKTMWKEPMGGEETKPRPGFAQTSETLPYRGLRATGRGPIESIAPPQPEVKKEISPGDVILAGEARGIVVRESDAGDAMGGYEVQLLEGPKKGEASFVEKAEARVVKKAANAKEARRYSAVVNAITRGNPVPDGMVDWLLEEKAARTSAKGEGAAATREEMDAEAWAGILEQEPKGAEEAPEVAPPAAPPAAPAGEEMTARVRGRDIAFRVKLPEGIEITREARREAIRDLKAMLGENAGVESLSPPEAYLWEHLDALASGDAPKMGMGVNGRFRGEFTQFAGLPGEKGARTYLYRYFTAENESWDEVAERAHGYHGEFKADSAGILDPTEFLELVDRVHNYRRNMKSLGYIPEGVGEELVFWADRLEMLKRGASAEEIARVEAEDVRARGATAEDADEALVAALGEFAGASTRAAAVKAGKAGAEAGYIAGRKDASAEVRRQLAEKSLSVEKMQKRLLDYLKRNAPPAARAKMMAHIAKVKTERSLLRELDNADEYIEKANQLDLREMIRREARRGAPSDKSGYLKGRRSPDVEAQLQVIRQNLDRDRDAVQAEIASNIEAYEKGTLSGEEMRDRNEILSMAGVNGMSAEELAAMLDNLRHIKKDGTTLAAAARASKAYRRAALTEKIVTTLTGGRGLKAGTRSLPAQQLEAIKTWLDRLANTQYGGDELMDKASKLDRESKPNDSPLNRLWNQIHDARGRQTRGVETVQQEVLEGLKETFGTDSRRQLSAILNRMQKEKVELGTFTNAAGVEVTPRATRDQWIKKYQELMDPTLTETFMEGMAWTDEMMDAVSGLLTPEEIAWAHWQMDFYQRYYDRVNAVYREVYGVDMPKNRFYSPIRRDMDSIIPESVLLAKESIRYATVTNGSLKARQKNIHPLKFDQGANATFINHVIQMEHFIGFADALSEVKAVLQDSDVRTAFRQYHGSDLLRKIDELVNDVARQGVHHAKRVRAVDFLRTSFTKAILGVKPAIALKQIPSVLAYTTEMPYGDFVMGVGHFWKNPLKNYRHLMEHSPLLAARFKKGFERDIRAAMQRGVPKALSSRGSVGDFWFVLIRTGDQLAVVQGTWAKYQSGLKAGLSEAEAMRAAERSTERTQPTSNLETLASLQRGGSFMKLFTMFQNQPNKYFRIVAANARNLRHGRGSRMKALSNILVTWIVLPSLFQLIADAGRFRPKKQARILALGPLNNLLVFGQMAQTVYGWGTGERYGYTPSPVFSTANDVQRAFVQTRKLIDRGGDPYKSITNEDVIKAIESSAQAIGKVTGVPTPYAVQVERAIRREKPAEIVFSRYALEGGKKKPSDEAEPLKLGP